MPALSSADQVTQVLQILAYSEFPHLNRQTGATLVVNRFNPLDIWLHDLQQYSRITDPEFERVIANYVGVVRAKLAEARRLCGNWSALAGTIEEYFSHNFPGYLRPALDDLDGSLREGIRLAERSLALPQADRATAFVEGMNRFLGPKGPGPAAAAAGSVLVGCLIFLAVSRFGTEKSDVVAVS